ncbi:MAG: hypothetical protein P4L83_09675 [Nevskia sp.]|nr:hypothetical protein [Nevskia sp.]
MRSDGLSAGGAFSSTAQEIAAIRAEVKDLEGFRHLAVSITENAKGLALLQALKAAFIRLAELGAPKKAIIFTESRRTQEYLLSLLSKTDHADSVVLFNGSNSDANARRIYTEWAERYTGPVEWRPAMETDVCVTLVFRIPAYVAANSTNGSQYVYGRAA